MLNVQPKLNDIKKVKKELEKEMIKGILEYVKKGTFPNNSPNSYMNAYTLVQNVADMGDPQCEELFKYHNKIIQTFIESCYKKINKLSGTQFVDCFIKETENINFLIYWMNRIFTYLDRFFTKAKMKNSLSKNAINLYRDYYFTLLQDEIHKEVNKLIKEDRNCNIESRPKIKIILKVINDLDLVNPKIIKENNKISWIPDKPEKSDFAFAQKWYNDSFEKETIKFVKDKANIDIHNMSAPEYITSQLKYLSEEKKREDEYINPKFYDKINKINYKYLVGENAEELGKMDTGISYMFTNKRTEELKKAYKLISLYPDSLKVIISAFSPYIKKRGEEINENK